MQADQVVVYHWCLGVVDSLWECLQFTAPKGAPSHSFSSSKEGHGAPAPVPLTSTLLQRLWVGGDGLGRLSE